MALRPVREHDTLPPPPPPSRGQRNISLGKAIEELGEQEVNLLKQLELVRAQREGLIRYRDYMDVVAAHDIEATP